VRYLPLRVFAATSPKQERLRIAVIDDRGSLVRKLKMRMKSISLATAFALASTAALAQGGAVGGRTQGAGTAGAEDKKGDASSPGGAMKK